ncbi:MAG: polyisoprenoid-binding protein YceI [Flavobacteriaceae bacterium]|jgi:polyisoprenoid-binding protein YceI|tara:strand:+ start:2701 stop:3267 length:567 start_codon:yes stop_codon:yes gene_type:complete
MKKKLFTLLFVATTSLSAWSQYAEMKINPSESSIDWIAKKITGQHEGNINLISGSIQMGENTISGGSFDVDMTSIIVNDLKGEYKAKLEGHLKSNDFFEVENFPTASLVITSATKKMKNHHEVTAELTIRGITNPITFEMHIENDNAMAKLAIDRTKYDIRYRSNSFFDNLGDIAIYNEFELDIKLKF